MPPSSAERRALAALIAAFPGGRVAGTGDVILDRFVEGSVGRISPEAPVPVLQVNADRTLLGGAGNVLANLAVLGTRAHFVAVVGDDPAGAELAHLFDSAAPTAAVEILIEPGRTTPVKTRFTAGGQQLLRVDREFAIPLGDETARLLCTAIEAVLDRVDVLVLSDYAKGTLTTEVSSELIAVARRHGKPVLVDPKGHNVARYSDATLIKPNRAELALATGLPVTTFEEALIAGRALLDRCNCANLLVTLGGDGMVLLEQGGAVVHRIPGIRREVYDVGGAGDTVLATLAAAMAAGGDLLAAAELANVAGGIAVSRRGTATVSLTDLQLALAEHVRSHEAKLLDCCGAKGLVSKARERGARIGFTNGCFDILHPGHVKLLAQARAACDLLIVGVNSDASVRRLKGSGRPVNPERARCLILASLESVDAVTLFDEDTPLYLIEELRPDLLVKGADYTLDRVVGADLVRGWGGEVMLAEMLPGFSTSGMITRISGGR